MWLLIRERSASLLLAGASTLEGKIAVVSLLTAAHKGMAGEPAVLDILLGAVSFLMIAVAKLNKIPLVGAGYLTRNWVWRRVFSVGLVFLMAIPFETMLNGGERGFAGWNHPIEKLRQEAVELVQHIDQRQGGIQAFLELPAEADHAEFTEITACDNVSCDHCWRESSCRCAPHQVRGDARFWAPNRHSLFHQGSSLIRRFSSLFSENFPC